MSIDFDPSDSTAATSWYRWHGTLSQPNYRIIEYFMRYGNPVDPDVLDNCSTKVREYAYRALGPVVAVGAAVLLAKYATGSQNGLLFAGFLAFQIGRIALHILGFSAQKENFIHVRGGLAPKDIENPKIMSWNILGFPAGMNYTCGGCIPFRDRFPEIVNTIRSKNPDIVVLQECLMDSSVTEAFVNAFKGEYSHFFTHNGPNKWGIESGLIIMTKSHVSGYTFTPFETNSRTFTRGFATLTIPAHGDRPAFAVIGTHMEAGSEPEDVENRKQQLAQIHAHARNLEDVSTVILAGDLNIDAAKQEGRDTLSPVLVSIYAPQPEGLETCTNELNKNIHPDDNSPLIEWVDQISGVRRGSDPVLTLTKFEVIKAYKRVNGKIDSKTALSDHNALVATLDNA